VTGLELTLERLKDYVDFIRPGADRSQKEQVFKKILRRTETGIRDLDNTRILLDDKEEILAGLRLVQLGQGFWILSELIAREDAGDDGKRQATVLIDEAMKRANHIKANQVFTRINTAQYYHDYGVALSNAGFRRIGERVEFRSPVENLPDEIGTPFTWKPMDQVGMNTAIDLFGQVGEGAPDWDEDDDPANLLTVYFSEEGLTSGPECLHVGYIDNDPAAVVIAQVSPDDGWSRITFMGLVLHMRGRGLGRWVHRHGFQMIREQGGTLYHGGCLGVNTAMVALFNAHSCQEHLRVEEWVWKASVR
jgi:hypothetical protein